MSMDTILEEARSAVDRQKARFSVRGGQGVRVTGTFPNYCLSGTVAQDTPPPLKDFRDAPLLTHLGDTFLTLSPGYVYDPETGYHTPTINGASILSQQKPQLPRHSEGGYVWLRREVHIERVPVITSDTGSISLYTPQVTSMGEFSIVASSASEPDPDTKYIAQAYASGQAGFDCYDFETFDESGFVHELLCSYNERGEILFITYGFSLHAPDTHAPGIYIPGGVEGRSALKDLGDATDRVVRNITRITPA